ncbi:MAG: hypothetical protein ACC609_07590 [Methanobacterium formicicum]
MLKKYKISFSLLLLSSILVLTTISAVNATQSSIYVSTEGNDSWSGENPTWNGTDGPKLTVQNAVNTVTINGTVNVASGSYFEKEIPLFNNVQITGAGSSNTFINAENEGIIFYVDQSVTATLSGITLKNGNFDVGGAIYNNGNLQLNDVTFQSNNALDSGGAVFNTKQGQLTVINCNFTGNTAPNGGGIYNYGTCTIQNSNFEFNTATQGGSITNYGVLSVNNVVFNSNHALEMGGALYNSPRGDVTIDSSSFTKNNVTNIDSYGGAISSYGLLTVTGTILTNNMATYGSSVANIGKLSALATGNWWGDIDGPDESDVYGDVDINNWLMSDPSILNNFNQENNVEKPLLMVMGGLNTNLEPETSSNTKTDLGITTLSNDNTSTETNNTVNPQGIATTTQYNTSTNSDPLNPTLPLASVAWGCLMVVGGVVLPRRK